MENTDTHVSYSACITGGTRTEHKVERSDCARIYHAVCASPYILRLLQTSQRGASVGEPILRTVANPARCCLRLRIPGYSHRGHRHGDFVRRVRFLSDVWRAADVSRKMEQQQ